MRKLIITHFLINLYLVALIGPAIPILEYWLNYDYIANDLCVNKDNPVVACNGMCYLQDQVEKQLQHDHESETPQPPKVDFEKFITLNTKLISYTFSTFDQKLIDLPFYREINGLLTAASLLKPPRI